MHKEQSTKQAVQALLDNGYRWKKYEGQDGRFLRRDFTPRQVPGLDHTDLECGDLVVIELCPDGQLQLHVPAIDHVVIHHVADAAGAKLLELAVTAAQRQAGAVKP